MFCSYRISTDKRVSQSLCHSRASRDTILEYDRHTHTHTILYRFQVIACFLSKVANFYPPHLHLSPQLGVILFEFRRELCCQKTRVMGLSCGIICVILRLAVLIQYLSVTNTQTDRQPDGFSQAFVRHVVSKM